MSAVRVTFVYNGATDTMELIDSMEIPEVYGFLQAIFGLNTENIVLLLNDKALPTGGTLAAAGVKNDDMIIVRQTAASSNSHAQSSRQAVATGSSSAPRSAGAVYWDGMTVEDVMANNTNPVHIVEIIQGHDALLRQLNFHNPKLAAHLKKDKDTAVRELRMFMMMNATSATIEKLGSEKKEKEMEQRLVVNPMDEEANRYFGEKLREEQVQQSYINMMQNYPESLAKVLMLYIEVEINGVSLQAFVDSGAQSSVMSGRCAETCNISRLIDSRFAGQVVGVGTGKTLGRIHLADIKIEGNFFPISLTVMDDSEGLGDKNMEFLLGLDMLKRHRCSIDLAEGKLYFHGHSGRVSTPFLHEKDLPESKGGTKGYNPNLHPPDSQ